MNTIDCHSKFNTNRSGITLLVHVREKVRLSKSWNARTQQFPLVFKQQHYLNRLNNKVHCVESLILSDPHDGFGSRKARRCLREPRWAHGTMLVSDRLRVSLEWGGTFCSFCFLVCWFSDALVLSSFGPLVIWSFGPLVSLVLWSFCHVVLLSFGPLVLRSFGQQHHRHQ